MREIARRCGVAPSTVSRTIKRAAAKLSHLRQNAKSVSEQLGRIGRSESSEVRKDVYFK